MLSVTSLEAGYGRSRVLHGLTLGCGRSEILCVVGRNGVGKSTALKSIMGLLTPGAGEIRFENEDLAGLPPHAVARHGIGYVPEDRLIFPDLTVAENLSMGQWKGFRNPARRDFDRCTALFPRLAGKMNQRGDTLSGGEQQMLAIARALMSAPKLLLIDEPTEGLAPVIVQSLEGAFQALAQDGVGLLIVESKLATARRIANRITIMAKGEAVFTGSPQALDAARDLRRLYLEV